MLSPKVIQESLDDNPHAALPLARMLIAGPGGPADPERARELLKTATTAPARAELGRQHLDGGILPRMPRRAIALMAEYATVDPEARQQLARLLVTYRVKLKNEADLHFRMLEDADLGLPGAALNVLDLHRVHREGFRSEKAWFDLLPRYSDSEPRIAVLNVGRLARFAVFSDGGSKTLFEKQVRDLIAKLEAQPVPGVFAVHSDLVRRGVVFPQDSVMSGLKPAEILAPFYDGFRISPTSAEDDMLVPLIKRTPDWIWRATEQVLVHNKYWQGKPAGHMGPEAREAFRRFIADAGPLSYQ